MLTLAIDPGLSTGAAWFREEELIDQFTLYRGVDGFLEWWQAPRRWHGTPDIVIYEDFIFDGTTTGRGWSSEIIGAIKALDWDGAEIVSQLRSDKATLFGQKHKGDAGERERFAWLAERGFSGTPHELDAISHTLVYMKRQRSPEALRRYWG